jgi:hypothetical protein
MCTLTLFFVLPFYYLSFFFCSFREPAAKRRRVSYSTEEDRLIIDFMAQHPKLRWGMNEPWELMQSALNTDRTWSSLKNRCVGARELGGGFLTQGF